MSRSTVRTVRDRLDELVVRERDPVEVDADLYRRSVKAVRGLALAEALLLIAAGFTLDDLNLLRVPGYAVGLGSAVLILAGGRLVHGRRLARRLASLDEDEIQDGLDAARLRNVLAAIGAVLAFLAWLVVHASGVPPWAM